MGKDGEEWRRWGTVCQECQQQQQAPDAESSSSFPNPLQPSFPFPILLYPSHPPRPATTFHFQA